jgi:predicted RNA-binding Zn-ribbon protein involved in translation (DUF1610 family)
MGVVVAHCTSCGSELTEGAKFCAQCGTAVEAQSGTDILRKAKTVACDAADDMIEGGSDLVHSDLGKKMAAGAAVGALVAAPIPIVGWAAGATIGAGLVAFRNITKKG